MPIWHDPLEELIADVERSLPATPPAPAFEIPPLQDFSIAVLSVISRNPAERQRLASHPAVQRVLSYLARTAPQRSSSVDPKK